MRLPLLQASNKTGGSFRAFFFRYRLYLARRLLRGHCALISPRLESAPDTSAEQQATKTTYSSYRQIPTLFTDSTISTSPPSSRKLNLLPRFSTIYGHGEQSRAIEVLLSRLGLVVGVPIFFASFSFEYPLGVWTRKKVQKGYI